MRIHWDSRCACSARRSSSACAYAGLVARAPPGGVAAHARIRTSLEKLHRETVNLPSAAMKEQCPQTAKLGFNW
ncbi:hypothetical protein chiPu_0005344 [Chiloscyllium punctatum]|uniref:Uncharacterized protein n=1 Tax=Chiloscyllium punctatum TaxID=137246 RepID=A0A401S972_CHIPU|nr:hypothetical protein [Chiloscyllium punctatum]